MLPDSPIRAVAFDMDGLLASSEDVYMRVGTETLARRGKPFEDELRHKMMGLPSPVAYRTMIEWHGLTETVEELAAESDVIFWELAERMLGPMPGVTETFDLVESLGLPRCVVTSGTRPYAERILSMIGVRERLAFVITADDITLGKPNPEPYLKAAARMEVEPSAMMVLEDSANGSRAGIAAGAFTVAVPSPHTQEHDFTGVKFVADTLRDPRIESALRAGR
ncbi:MAG: HAD family hydrolase [Lacipirellulaceae bacterium]